MQNMTENEVAALEKAGENAGAYLEQIGKESLGELTAEEWQQFLAEVMIGFSQELRRLEAKSNEAQ
jgi:hypothetical protein